MGRVGYPVIRVVKSFPINRLSVYPNLVSLDFRRGIFICIIPAVRIDCILRAAQN